MSETFENKVFWEKDYQKLFKKLTWFFIWLFASANCGKKGGEIEYLEKGKSYLDEIKKTSI